MTSLPIHILPAGISYEFVNKVPVNKYLENLKTGFKAVGLLGNQEEILLYEDLTNWERGGAETYIAQGRLQTSLAQNIHFIAKAYVGMSPIREKVVEWTRRRQFLAENGICFPKLYGVYKGTIYEEYISHSVDEDRDVLSDELKLQVARIAGIVDSLGFTSLNFLGDIRFSIRSAQVYYVDFGFDLGEANSDMHSNLAFQQLKNAFSHDGKYESMVEAYEEVRLVKSTEKKMKAHSEL
ncbi:hypothetical protein LCGC14_2012850 [marine sediment metagenome]|uniref:Aminoglycoside phosphotransferase domain-containing protein n=1 Tax=marine sediment metagenome TaxID=412755 RepID=A0A0F9EZX8_9ZZZZ